MGVCWKLEAPETVRLKTGFPIRGRYQKESIHEHQISVIYT